MEYVYLELFRINLDTSQLDKIKSIKNNRQLAGTLRQRVNILADKAVASLQRAVPVRTGELKGQIQKGPLGTKASGYSISVVLKPGTHSHSASTPLSYDDLALLLDARRYKRSTPNKIGGAFTQFWISKGGKNFLTSYKRYL